MTDKDFVVPLLAANARENVPEQVTGRAFWCVCVCVCVCVACLCRA